MSGACGCDEGAASVMMDVLRQQIRQFLRFDSPTTPVAFVTHQTDEEAGYRRLRISYVSPDGDLIPAFLLLPAGDGPFPAVLIHHQHNSQRHLGKSEVCGLIGAPLQAFGPVLARRGFVVLVPDSICFEDRRRNRTGTEADGEADVEQHYNEMCYRLLRGDTLMRKVLSDSAHGISLLSCLAQIDVEKIGMLGHSYGGNTVLFHGALDTRIRFACSSGAASSYRYKLAHQVGIEMAEVIPSFVTRYDIADLVACFAPRRILLVSATDDAASHDAAGIVRAAEAACATTGSIAYIEHQRYDGGHALTQERFDSIVHWMTSYAR
jgi:dienelactone hydrolase